MKMSLIVTGRFYYQLRRSLLIEFNNLRSNDINSTCYTQVVIGILENGFFLVVFHDRQTTFDGMIGHVFFSQWQNRYFWPVQVLYVQLITFTKREPTPVPSGVKT